MKPVLSILIPARNERWLNRTIEDILKNSEVETEIIVGLDGVWGTESIPQHPKVTVIYFPESIGQRAITNRCCALSSAKYVMKCDSHCSFDKGFDRKLIEDMNDNWVVVPAMKNLHVFDWVCKKCGARKYQGPTPTECWGKKCDSKDFEMDIKWFAKPSPFSTSYRFNSQLEFKYWGEYKKRQKGDIVDTLSLQGSCFMLTREKYLELNICDESWGSWGGQGAEISLKTWLSGGEVKVNKNTWYAHLFRTQGGDFGFPYSNPGNEQKKAKDTLRDTFLNGKWEKQIIPLSKILEDFSPVPDWDENKIKELKAREAKNNSKLFQKGIVYYTTNNLKWSIAKACRKNIKASGLPIVSVSRKKTDLGTNIVLKGECGTLKMYEQILTGLKALNTKNAFLCEHDVLYHESHFDFTPPTDDKFYFNENVWHLNYETGKAVHYDCKQNSGLCANRELLIKWAEEKVQQCEENKFDRHYEPQKNREGWKSEIPNIDIRHKSNLTKSKWSLEDFRNKPKFFEEAKEIPDWGTTDTILKSL